MKLKKRKFTAVFLAVLLSISILLSGFLYLTMPVYLSEDEAICTIISGPDGVRLVLETAVEGYEIWYKPMDEAGNQVALSVIAWKTRLGELVDQLGVGEVIPADYDKAEDAYVHDADNRIHASITIPSECDFASYASRDGSTEDVYLYGNNNSQHSITLPRLAMSYYFMLSVGLGGLLLILWLIFRKRKPGKAILWAGLFFLSFSVAELIVMGGDFQTYHMFRGLLSALLASIPIWGTCISGLKLLEQTKSDSFIL